MISAAHVLWLTGLARIAADQIRAELEAVAFGYIFPDVEDYSGEAG